MKLFLNLFIILNFFSMFLMIATFTTTTNIRFYDRRTKLYSDKLVNWSPSKTLLPPDHDQQRDNIFQSFLNMTTNQLKNIHPIENDIIEKNYTSLNTNNNNNNLFQNLLNATTHQLKSINVLTSTQYIPTSSLPSSSTSSSTSIKTKSNSYRKDTNTSSNDYNDLKIRIEKIEKAISTLSTNQQQLQSSNNQQLTTKATVNDLMDAFNRGQLAMSPRNVERCSIVTFFFIGSIIGASLFDRLWLLGGIITAWWASAEIHRNSRSGDFVRKCGAQLAQLIRDTQEKYNQAIIFYQTGKLAYVTSKTWDKYDKQFSITQKADRLKQLAMERASSFNSTMLGNKELYDQMSDIWNVIVTAPSNAVKLNREYKFTSSLGAFTIAAYYQTLGWMKTVISDDSTLTPSSSSSSKAKITSNNPTLFHSVTSIFKNKEKVKSNFWFPTNNNNRNIRSISSTYNNPYAIKKKKVGIVRQLFLNIKTILLNIYNILFLDEESMNRNKYRSKYTSTWTFGSNSNNNKSKKNIEKTDLNEKVINIIAIVIMFELFKQFIIIFIKILK